MNETKDPKSTCKVTVKLKNSQQSKEEDLWNFTYKGKQLQALNKYITWYCDSHEEAVNSFNLNEVDEYTINLRADYFNY